MKRVILTVALSLCACAALAQMAPAPSAPGMMHSMPHMMPHFRPGMMRPGIMGHMPIAGQIIGNKKTHVYHLAGDRNLPAPQNRVMFPSVAAAVAAGYHASGKGGHAIPGKPMPHAMMPVPHMMHPAPPHP